MKKIFFSLIALASTMALQAADKVESITSPDGKLKVEVAFGSELKFSVYDGSNLLLKDSRIGMTVQGGPKVGVNPVLKKKATATINEEVPAPFYRQTTVENNCNEMTLKMADGFNLVFRAYNSGVAYRFTAEKKGDIIVESELAEYNFPEDYEAWIPYVNESSYGPYAMSFENMYQHIKLSEAKAVAFTPLAVDCKTAKVSFMESDLESYPGIFLRASNAKLTAGVSCSSLIVLGMV